LKIHQPVLEDAVFKEPASSLVVLPYSHDYREILSACTRRLLLDRQVGMDRASGSSESGKPRAPRCSRAQTHTLFKPSWMNNPRRSARDHSLRSTVEAAGWWASRIMATAELILFVFYLSAPNRSYFGKTQAGSRRSGF